VAGTIHKNARESNKMRRRLQQIYRGCRSATRQKLGFKARKPMLRFAARPSSPQLRFPGLERFPQDRSRDSERQSKSAARFWSASVLWRYASPTQGGKSAKGLAQSKTMARHALPPSRMVVMEFVKRLNSSENSK
jgi:hypothetical protein